MAYEFDMGKISRIISWIDGYRGYVFKDPEDIDEAVREADFKPLSRCWMTVREDVKEIYSQQGRLSNALRMLRMASNMVLFLYLAIYLLATMFNVQAFKILALNPVFLIAILGLTFLYPVFKYRKIKEIKERSKSETYAKRLQRIRRAVQDLIFHLCEEIRSERRDPNKYKMQLSVPDYQGIVVVRSPGVFGSEYYTVIPSVLGAVLSRAKRYIKVVDPWATEREIFAALLKVSSKVKIKALIPDEIGENKRFKQTWRKVKEKAAENIDILSYDLNKLNNRIVITEKKAWLAARREWYTLVEVKDRKKRDALEASFDEKWKRAHPVI